MFKFSGIPSLPIRMPMGQERERINLPENMQPFNPAEVCLGGNVATCPSALTFMADEQFPR